MSERLADIAANGYWSIKEVAEYLEVSPRTVQRWVAKGQLPAVKIGRRLVRIPRQAVRAFIARQTRLTLQESTAFEGSTCAAQQLAQVIRFRPAKGRSLLSTS